MVNKCVVKECSPGYLTGNIMVNVLLVNKFNCSPGYLTGIMVNKCVVKECSPGYLTGNMVNK